MYPIEKDSTTWGSTKVDLDFGTKRVNAEAKLNIKKNNFEKYSQSSMTLYSALETLLVTTMVFICFTTPHKWQKEKISSKEGRVNATLWLMYLVHIVPCFMFIFWVLVERHLVSWLPYGTMLMEREKDIRVLHKWKTFWNFKVKVKLQNAVCFTNLEKGRGHCGREQRWS